MADVFNKTQRSAVMRAVPASGSRAEMRVRQIVRELGYRCGVNVSVLPGRPDLVFRRKKKVIFVHGCFWHRHRCEAGRSTPASQIAYWSAKFQRNTQRDRRVRKDLAEAGWQVLTIWECQLKRPTLIRKRVSRFLAEQG